jgi:hypothetical protein
MSTEVIPLSLPMSDEVRILHLREGAHCVKCGTSMIAMRRYFTTDQVTYDYVDTYPGTDLKTLRADSAMYRVCMPGDCKP